MEFFFNTTPKILIIEDESLVANGLIKNIRELIPEARIYPILTSVKKALHWFDKNEVPDLIFSDVQLSDGISFDIFEQYEPACPVIFTTAYDQYALKAFEVNSVDFLLKPIGKDDLRKSLEKLKKRWESYRLPNLNASLRQSVQGQLYLERFLVQHNQGFMPVIQDEVGCFQKDELIFTWKRDGKRYLTDFNSIDELESKLNPALFFRANRQFIIRVDNIMHIKSTHKGIKVQLHVPQQFILDVSREKAQIFKKWLLGS
ncbi:LytTR family DNA-binding domain-containing protein [Algoriphagus sp. AGSA1]|uniref:LytR/AlgR family response regulator transcription factor n=1 Tax=Algoriphagus sp. AGSA1 TaxID=2907213 RepID=UPI001F3B7962|nr:LytTR family DNA-binding domain-containing protein [Algoriphagus sp. AGSA1]MCE7057428.1 LytTR family DNA-binding domain-containing protein [Algoriphagus sp. AGSA1]